MEPVVVHILEFAPIIHLMASPGSEGQGGVGRNLPVIPFGVFNEASPSNLVQASAGRGSR